MPKIRIVRGSYRKLNGKRAEPGDVIELDESSIERLPQNKFEYVDDESESEPDDSDTDSRDSMVEEEFGEEPESVSPEPADPSDIIPYDDYQTLSSMAANFDGPEVHGAMSGDDITSFFETLTVSELSELRRRVEGDD